MGFEVTRRLSMLGDGMLADGTNTPSASFRRYGRMGGRRERARRGYRFSSLMNLKKKGNFTLSCTSPEKELFFYIYDVIVKQKIKKRSVYLSSLLLRRD
jgi:hypothetical protein